MDVCARFIRVREQIINVDKIVRIGINSESGVITGTWMLTTTPIKGDQTVDYIWEGDIVDEIWDILHAASTEHLGPYDKLREIAVL